LRLSTPILQAYLDFVPTALSQSKLLARHNEISLAGHDATSYPLFLLFPGDALKPPSFCLLSAKRGGQPFYD